MHDEPYSVIMLSVMNASLQRAARSERGFTLVELLITVAMVGVLAALATFGYRRWIASARSAEAREMLGAIGMAQQLYFDETRGYLNCSSSWKDFYPGKPGSFKRNFTNPSHGKHQCWRLLNIRADSPVVMGYTVRAGTAGKSPPASDVPGVKWPATTTPWWVAQASGDSDDNGILSYFMTSSFNAGEIVSANDVE
jgi:type IV pilus assembly protein PilA